MCTSIYNTYKTNKFEPSQNKELSSIINDIRSDIYADKVSKIKQAKPEEQKTLKGNLPLFKTCLDVDDEPNGLIHFDIDTKDNPSIDFIKLKQDILKIPELAYCFISPRGGLKLAINSDFRTNDEYDNQRFKLAYKIAKGYVQDHIEPIEFDDSLALISQDCFVSHDPDAYLNLNATLLKLDDDCVHVAPDYSRLETGNSVTESQIVDLLSYIPPDLDYDERLPINYAVLHELGSAGIFLLMNHWSTSDRSELESKLYSQLKNMQFGNIGTLIKKARDFNPKKTLFKHEIKESSHNFPDLLTVEQADAKLKNAIHNFFDNGVSTFINTSTGFGKTTDTLNILKQLPRGKRVLVLVQSHEFAEELISKYRAIKGENFGKTLTPFQRALNQTKTIYGIVHIKGKSHFTDEQDYINQFNSTSNIRVLTHEELFNEQASYWYGSSHGDYSAPRKVKKGARKTDYIIVDENCFKRVPASSNLNTEYSSIRKIISNVIDDGVTLKQAVDNNIDAVNEDYQSAKAIKSPSLQAIHTELNGDNRRNVIDKLVDVRKDSWSDYYHLQNNELKILKELKMGEYNQLKVIEELKELHLFQMNELHNRFEGVPILYLDATASETVIKTLLPYVEYVDLKVKQKDDVHVYMASDFPCSKSWLKKQDNLDQVVEMLKKRGAENSNIGFITYLNIEGIDGKFDKWLSAETGIEIYEHFGNLRGSDKFEDVDELYIIGRQYLKPYEFDNLAHAVFDCDDISDAQEWLECPIRMKDGSCMSVMNKKYIDNRAELVKQHFSDSETLQAIGRGRLIHGKSKDVYLLSNESLGADVEISGFITKKDMFNFTKFDEQINKAVVQGYCENKPMQLKEVGFTKHHLDNNKQQIEDELISAGFEKVDVYVKDKHRIKRSWEYYVLDVNKMAAHLESIGASLS